MTKLLLLCYTIHTSTKRKQEHIWSHKSCQELHTNRPFEIIPYVPVEYALMILFSISNSWIINEP